MSGIEARPGLVEARANPPTGPSRWWYGVAALILVAGLVAAGAIVFRVAQDAPDKLSRVVAPGELEVALTEPGTYTIYHEYRSVVAGRVFSANTDISSLQVEMEGPGGEPVALRPPGGNFEYSFQGRSGIAALVFDVETPGTYRMVAGYPEGSGPQIVLALGQGLGSTVLLGLVAGIGIPFFAAVLAAAIAIITMVRRRRAGQMAPEGARPG